MMAVVCCTKPEFLEAVKAGYGVWADDKSFGYFLRPVYPNSMSQPPKWEWATVMVV